MKINIFICIVLSLVCIRIEASSEEKLNYKDFLAEEGNWNCDACTFLNDSTATRCQLCNTVKDYLKITQASRDQKLSRYERKYDEETLSFFHPYPDMKGSNSSDTALSKVDEHLWLSGSYVAKDLETLDNVGISSVLNCSGTDIMHDEHVYTYKHGIDLMQLPINDTAKDIENLKRHLKAALEFIDKNIAEGKDVLIHCSAGVSRSATITLAYLMKKNNWNILEAFAYLRSKRTYVYPNLGFWDFLIDFNNSLKGVDTIDKDILSIHVENLNKN